VLKDLFSVSDRQHKLAVIRHPIGFRARRAAVGILDSLSYFTAAHHEMQAQTGWSYDHSPIVGEHLGAPPIGAKTLTSFSQQRPEIKAWRFFRHGPHAGERAPDASYLYDHANREVRLYDVIGGTKHKLLLLTGTDALPDESIARACALARHAQTLWGEHLDAYVVRRSQVMPHSADWSGPFLFDPSEALHRRYNALKECLYLIRPDGYIAFRHKPISRDSLVKYMDRIVG
jgi:hypothetical protein